MNADPMSAHDKLLRAIDDLAKRADVHPTATWLTLVLEAENEAALRASIPPETPTRVVVTGGDHADSEGRACYHATPAPSLEGARHPEAGEPVTEAGRRWIGMARDGKGKVDRPTLIDSIERLVAEVEAEALAASPGAE